MNLKNHRLWGLLVLLFLIIIGSAAYQCKWVRSDAKYVSKSSTTPGTTTSTIPVAAPSAESSTADTVKPTSSAPSTPVAASTITLDISKPQDVSKLGQTKVAIVQADTGKAEDIQYAEIKSMVSSAVELAGGFKELIRNGQTVVIKPNLVTHIDYTLPGWKGRPLSPEMNGTTTDYRVTRAIVELVRKYNPKGKVYVMEGSAFPTENVMKKLKYTPEFIPGVTEFITIEKDSGGWKDYNSPNMVKVPLASGLLHKEYYMNKKYYNADVLISVPVLKTHWTEVVSGSIKNVGIGATPANVYGKSIGDTNRGNMVDHGNDDINKWLHDWFKCKPVNFVIVDGLQGIQNGPTPCFDISGTTDLKQDQMNTRVILAGSDAAAVDTISSLAMQIHPESVPYLHYFAENQLGITDIANITVVGKRVDEIRKDFKGAGSKITDFTAPILTVKKADFHAGKLALSLSADNTASKIEVYVDGTLQGILSPSNPSDINVDITGIEDKKKYLHVRLRVYDSFLNTSYADVHIADSKADILKAGDYTASKAAKAPVIDGIANESCWKNAQWNEMKYPWGPVTTLPASDDFNGRYKIVWTPEKLYALVEIRDDTLVDTHKDPLDSYWEDDCVEFFIDEDHSGGDHQYNYNAFAYHIGIGYTVADLTPSGKAGLFTNHMQARCTNKGTVYTWEIAIEVYNDKYDDSSNNNKPVKLFAGKELGSAIAYCDSDSNKRENFVGSIPVLPLGEDFGWRDASCFGTLRLVN